MEVRPFKLRLSAAVVERVASVLISPVCRARSASTVSECAMMIFSMLSSCMPISLSIFLVSAIVSPFNYPVFMGRVSLRPVQIYISHPKVQRVFRDAKYQSVSAVLFMHRRRFLRQSTQRLSAPDTLLSFVRPHRSAQAPARKAL